MTSVWTNLGGTLGVWVGIAFMSFFEAMDLFLDYASIAWFLVCFRDKVTRKKADRNSEEFDKFA